MVLFSLRLLLAVLATEADGLVGHQVAAARVDGGNDGEGDDGA